MSPPNQHKRKRSRNSRVNTWKHYSVQIQVQTIKN